MSEEDELGSLLVALDYLARPTETNSLFTVADLDTRTIVAAATLLTLAKELGDKTLEEFVKNLLALSRSKKRRGAKELINLFKAARTKTYISTMLTRSKRIMVGEHAEPEE
ncbi:MAG: hypothetical protein J7J94_02705 [Thaumarchaeota archaeon]|nr:hypothetical protein [Nitrososphaerota archaeon]